MFFSGSKDKPPGKGASEYILEDDVTQEKYSELQKYVDWRKLLSNFWQRCDIESKKVKSLFLLDELEWTSVEHCFQANKFKDIDSKYYKSFSLESKSSLSVSNGNAAKKAGRKFKLTKDQLEKWNKSKSKVMYNCLKAKYSQNEDLKKLLLSTKDAILTHRPPRSKVVILEKELMEVRKILTLNP